MADGPDFSLEIAHRDYAPVCGVDEAGRGPWAGPVVAAAVILDPGTAPEGLNDSKKLARPAREGLHARLREVAEFGVGIASVEEIETLNILGASFLAMRRAIEALPRGPGLALIDGNRSPAAFPCRTLTVIGGDGRCRSIAAASIIAKVTRDAIMAQLARECPGYGWETNAGYGTSAHRDALARLGVTPHHRRGFRPIHNMLCEEETLTP